MGKKIIGKIYCVECTVAMEKATLSTYEYQEGCVLNNVDAFKCPDCGEIFFTEKQAQDMEKRTECLVIKTIC